MVGSSQQDAQQQRRWGEYYFGDASQPSSQLKGRKSWVLETIYAVNQMIPSFNELFDQVLSGTNVVVDRSPNFQETFYVFALCIVAVSVFAVFVMARVFKVRVREYPLNVDREWRDWRPANPFHFPWREQPTPTMGRGNEAAGASSTRRPHQD